MEFFRDKYKVPTIAFCIWALTYLILTGIASYIGIILLSEKIAKDGDLPTAAALAGNVVIFICVMTIVLLCTARVTFAIVQRKHKAEGSGTDTGKGDADDLNMRDPLTGIRNIAAYAEEVKHLNQELGTGLPELGIALVDLNGLKKINDECGMEKGDEAIKSLCFIVCHVFEHSPVFRINGDQFVVILKNIDLQNIDFLLEAFAERLARLEEDDSLKPWEKVSAAIGVAFYDPDEDTSVENILKRAERAMFANKEGAGD